MDSGTSRVDEQWVEKVNVFADTGGWSVGASHRDPSNVASWASAVGEILIIGTMIEGAVGSRDNEMCPDRTNTSFRLCNIPNFVIPSGSLQHFQLSPIRNWLSIGEVMGGLSHFPHLAVLFSAYKTLVGDWHLLLLWLSTGAQTVRFLFRLLLWAF
jgi:hypothetical protein